MKWENTITSSDMPSGGAAFPIIFANACDNGWPEMKNLAREYIKNGCSGIVSASRTSWYILGWDGLGDGGDASLAYYFWEAFAKNKNRLGEATFRSKVKYLKHFHQEWQHFHNAYTYNLLGDPTLRLNTPEVMCGGIVGTVVSRGQFIKPIDGAVIEVQGTSLKATTGNDGRFQIFGILGGAHVLTVKRDSSEIMEIPVAIVNGEKAEMEIELSRDALPVIEMIDYPAPISFNEGHSVSSHLHISNSGRCRLKYRCEFDPVKTPWLEADSTVRTVMPGDTVTFPIIVNSLDLDRGRYDSQFMILSNDPDKPNIEIPISIQVIDTIPPLPISDFQIVEVDGDSVELTWTAPGDNGYHGRAERYEIWISDQLVPDSDYRNFRLLIDSLIPGHPGTREQITVSLLNMTGARWIVIKTFDEAGLFSFSKVVPFIQADVQESHQQVTSFGLAQNYPNPFNATTSIHFTLSRTTQAVIRVYNSAGKLVRVLVDRKLRQGNHVITWNGRDALGRSVASGTYFYELNCPAYRKVKKLSFIK